MARNGSSILDDLLDAGKAGVTSATSGLATAAALGQESLERAGNVVAGRKAFDGDASRLRTIAQDLAASADASRANISEEHRTAMAASTPRGNLLRGEFDLGEDPSLAGYALNITQGLGSIVPGTAAAVATRGRSLRTQTAVGAGVGGATGGGFAAQDEGARVRDMQDAALAQLPAYQQAIAEGLTPAQAREATARSAERGAFVATAPVSALGGAATSALFGSAAQRAIAGATGGGRVSQGIASGLVGAAEEGLQETAEGVAQRLGASAATGEQGREIGEESASNFVLGATTGAAAGAGAGVLAPEAATTPGPSAPQNIQPAEPVMINPRRGVLSRAVAAGASEGTIPGVVVESPEFLGAPPPPADGMPMSLPPDLPPTLPGQAVDVLQEAPASAARAADRGMPYATVRDGQALTIAPFKGLKPADRLVEAEAARQVLSDPQAAVEAYKKLRGTDGGRVISTDEARELFPIYSSGPEGRSQYALAVHEPSSFVAKQVWAQALERDVAPDRDPLVLFTAGGTGAGKTTAIKRDDSAQAMYDAADLIYDGNLQSFKSAQEKIEDAIESGRKVAILYVHRDPIVAFSDGAIPRANKESYGRTVPISAHAGTHIGAARTIQQLAETYRDSPDVSITMLDNSGNEVPVHDSIVSVGQMQQNDLEEKLREAAQQSRDSGRMSARVARYYFPEDGEGAQPGAGETARPESGDGQDRRLGKAQPVAGEGPVALGSAEPLNDARNPDTPAGKMLAALGSATAANPFDERERVFMREDGNAHGAAELYGVSGKPSELRVSAIRSFNPGTGGGREMLQQLTRMADESGVTLRLSAEPFGSKALSKAKLQAWYSRHGFVRKGGEMVRAPQVQALGRRDSTRAVEGDLSNDRIRSFDIERDGQKIGTAEAWKDDYAGRNNAWHLGFVGVDQQHRGGSGASAIRAAVNQLMQADGGPEYVTAEAMSKKSLRSMLRVLGKPVLVSNDIRELTVDEALASLPDDSTLDRDGYLHGDKVFVAFKLPKSRKLAEPRSRATSDFGVIVAPKPGTKVTVDGETRPYQRGTDTALPPLAAPVQREPDLEALHAKARAILKRPAAAAALRRLFGVKAVKLQPIRGSYEGEPELSFALAADGLGPDNAPALATFLGMAFAQDAVIVTKPDPVGPTEDSIPSLRLYNADGTTLDDAVFDAVTAELREEGIDYSEANGGREIRVLHFGDEAGLEALSVSMSATAAAHKLQLDYFHTRSDLYEAQDYRGHLGEAGDQAAAGQPSRVFRALVDHFLVPYARASDSVGYRFDAQRYADRYGIGGADLAYLTQKLGEFAPRSTAPLLSGEEPVPQVDGRPTNIDAAWFLQNRAAAMGVIKPDDRSDAAKEAISETFAQEVEYQLSKPEGKQAIGWYDRQLSAAMDTIAEAHPEIASDEDAGFIFKALLAITSQGLPIEQNFNAALRAYARYRASGKLDMKGVSLPGTATNLIRDNISKLSALIKQRGLAGARDWLRATHTIRELKAAGFHAVKGRLGDTARGWHAFGPKIGSFANNLDGDFDTLTADLWFTRTWNRVLGTMFRYSAEAEAKQVREFRGELVKALNDPGNSEVVDGLSDEERASIGTLEGDFAIARKLTLHYRRNGFKDRSPLNVAAKKWIENVEELTDTPRGDPERRWQDEVMHEVQDKIAARTGQRIAIADLQAMLWYQEKELFRLLGAANRASAPLDYQDAARAAIAQAEGVDRRESADDDRVRDAQAQVMRQYGAALAADRREREQADDATIVETAYPLGYAHLLGKVRGIAKGARVVVVAGTDKAASRVAVTPPLSPQEAEKAVAIPGVRRTYPGTFPQQVAAEPPAVPVRFQVPPSVTRQRHFAALDEQQRGEVDAVLATLKTRGYPAAWLKGAAFFFAHNNDQEFAARFVLRGEAKGAVSFRQNQFGNKLKLLRNTAHELAHAADYDPENDGFYSIASPLFAVAKTADGSIHYTGQAIAELEANSRDSRSPLYNELIYPFKDESFTPEVMQVEAFAQAVMLYITQRADLKTRAPTAYALVKEIFENERQAGRSSGRGAAALQKALRANGSRPLAVRDEGGRAGTGDRQVNRAGLGRPAADRGEQRSGAVAQVDSPAFQRWFGSSVVANADGSPRVVYHGTKADFDVFRTSPNDIGFHFGTPEQASHPAFTGRQAEDGGRLMPVYLSLQNPVRMEDTFGDSEGTLAQVEGMGLFTEDQLDTLRRLEPDWAGTAAAPTPGPFYQKLAELLESKGHDGIVYLNRGEAGQQDDAGRLGFADSYIVFRPEQVKSATANSGAFDPNEPSILGARDPMAPATAFDGYTIPSWEVGQHLSDEAGKRLDGYKSAAAAGADKLRTYLQDYFLPVKRLQEAITARGGRVTEDTDVYAREEVYYGRTGEQMRRLEDEHVKPLVKAMVDAGVKQDDLELYLYAKFAPTRNARIAEINPRFPDGGSGMTDADAAQVLADFDKAGLTKKLEPLAKRVYALNDVRLRTLEEGGLLSPGEAELWRSEPSYVPLKGFAESISDGGETVMPTGRGFSIGGREAHRALGRKSRAADILANAIAQAEQAIIRAEKNRVATALLRLAEENPNEALWSVDVAPEKPQLSAAGEVTYRKDNRHVLADNVVAVKVAGEQHFITLHDKRLAAAMKNLGAAKTGAFLRAFSGINRFLSLTRTMLAPEFVLANFSRDIQTAAVNLSGEQSAAMAGKVVKDVPKAMRAMWGQLRGKSQGGEWSRWAQEFSDEGGMTSFVAQYTVEEQQDKINALLKDANGGTPAAIRRLAKGTLDLIEDANGAVENATRLAAYANARRGGMSKQEAARLAKNLTVNFNRKGQAGPAINALYLFYNASIQGTQRFLRAMKSPRARQIMATTAVLGYGIAAMNRAIGGEDDDGEDRWDKIPDWVKARNLIIFIPGGDGDMVKIPLPYSYNIPFLIGGAVEDMVGGRKSPSSVAANITEALLTSFNPIGDIDLEGDSATAAAKFFSPTAADPLVDIAVNRNFFGAPINPERSPFDKVPEPDSQLAFPSANPLAKWLANALNTATGGDALHAGAIDVSPGSMVYIFDYLTGGTGSFVERAAGAAALAAQGEPVPARTIPFARVFAGSMDERRVTDTFYRLRDDVNLKAEMAKTGLTDTPGERQEAMLGRRLSGPLKAAERQLRRLRDQRKQAQGRGDKARVEVLKQRELAVQLRFNTVYFKALDALDQHG